MMLIYRLRARRERRCRGRRRPRYGVLAATVGTVGYAREAWPTRSLAVSAAGSRRTSRDPIRNSPPAPAQPLLRASRPIRSPSVCRVQSGARERQVREVSTRHGMPRAGRRSVLRASRMCPGSLRTAEGPCAPRCPTHLARAATARRPRRPGCMGLGRAQTGSQGADVAVTKTQPRAEGVRSPAFLSLDLPHSDAAPPGEVTLSRKKAARPPALGRGAAGAFPGLQDRRRPLLMGSALFIRRRDKNLPINRA